MNPNNWLDTLLMLGLMAVGIWFFGRVVLQIRKSIANLNFAPTVVIVPTEEDNDDTYTSLDEQQAIEGFVALLERANFRRLDTIKVTNTWLATTMHSICPLYVSQDHHTSALLDHAQGIFPAILTLISGFADGASLNTSTPYGTQQDASFLHRQFAFNAETALKAHLSRSQELEKQHGHIIPITSVADYEQSRQTVLRHFDPAWNESPRQLSSLNLRLYVGVVVILLMWALFLLLHHTTTKAVFMAIALVIIFVVAATVTSRWNNRNLRLQDALDAGNVPTPDIRYPPIFEWNRPKKPKVKETS